MAFPAITASSQNGPSGFDANSLSITKPTCAVGDTLLVALAAKNFTGTEMTLDLSGFTLRTEGLVNPSLPHLALNLYEKTIDGTEASTFTATSTDAAYLYAYAFVIPASAYHSSSTSGSSGAFDNAHLLESLPSLTGDTLVIGVLLGYTDALTAGPSGWTTLYGPTDGILYAWSDEVTGALADADLTPLDTDRWVSVTIGYEATIVNVTGTIAVTDANDTPTMSGTVTIPGTIAVTDDTDTFAGTGTAPNWVAGTIDVTDESDTFIGLYADAYGPAHMVDDDDEALIVVNRFGGAPTVRRETGPVFLNRRRRQYFNPSRNPVTGP